MRLRNLGYDCSWKAVKRPGLPVVSVGNLSVGGTGKSPMVAWLARWFREREVRVAILSRGYARLASGQNDEALELALLLPDVPHLQHWDRFASAVRADKELEMQMLLLDDGFQHRRIARDLDIVLLDATDSEAARWLLPGGLLREPMSSLRRADVIVLTRADQVSEQTRRELAKLVHAYSPDAKVVTACHRPATLLVYPDTRQDVLRLRDRRVLAFCAIGNPESFFRGLDDLGASVIERRTWPDHHNFTAADIASLAAWSEKIPAAEMMVCTMKDWVKIRTARIAKLELAAVQIELELLDEQAALEKALDGILGLVRARANAARILPRKECS